MPVTRVAAPVPFEEHHLNEARELILETIQKAYEGVYGKHTLRYFMSYHSDDNLLKDAREGHFFLYYDNGLVGTGTLAGRNIRRVFVAPEAQGKGYGHCIMQHLEQVALRKKLDFIELNASLPSIGFYQNLAYTDLGFCRFPVGEGEYLDYRRMAKKIDSSSHRPEINLEGKQFMISGKSKNPFGPDRGILCRFSQKDGLFFTVYESVEAKFGEIIGCIEKEHFKTESLQWNRDGTIKEDRSTGRVFVQDDGRVLLQNIVSGRDMSEYLRHS
ncbi:GNAT family N-acetyltransferase [Balneolaceae bacterium ANBcel3]|nr:GNAT family N-acetyltransferase [Balneolaceae bacterium ANBcel3]